MLYNIICPGCDSDLELLDSGEYWCDECSELFTEAEVENSNVQLF
jgi:predicted amidophosphoribosyltransferase